MHLAPADRPRPAAAPVAPSSVFAAVATAAPVVWSQVSGIEPLPAGGGRLTMDLGGRWERSTDGTDWHKVLVPDSFGFDAEHSRHFDPMWYRRSFADPRVGAPDGSPRRTWLQLAAVDYFAEVSLDGEMLGAHEGCFAPFRFDVTDRLRRESEVVVRVHDPLEPLDPGQLFFFHRKRIIKGTLKYHDSRPGGLPGRMSHPLAGDDSPVVWTPEWGQSMTTAGITGPVSLVRHGDVSLDGLFVTPLDHESGALQIAAVLVNHRDAAVDALLHLAVGDDRAAIEATVPPGAHRVDCTTVLPRLERWEPVHGPRGSPALHDLHATVTVSGSVTDRRVTRFGLRTARVVTGADGRPHHLEVNGRPTFVKAVNYIPWQHFAEVGRAFYDRDMRMITAAHANSVGVHAHVQSPHAYDAADAAGVLVFQDFPLQWFYDSGTESNPGFVEEAQRQIAEMAYLLHAHPSVVYYACHNEPRRQFIPTPEADDTPERDLGERHLDAALFATLTSVDGSRHVHEASGIGDDVHSYHGSLMGGSLYDVGEMPAWFVSEYGFWTVGPQAAKFGDAGWPPDVGQMRDWVSRLSFIGTTVGYAGLPSRYDDLAAWSDATQAYGAALAKHQTEWFRIHRGAPFMGYRWHFWSDWWGYAGGGLVDVDRVEKETYRAFRDASRPLLVTGRVDGSIVAPGTVAVPIVCVNDTHRSWRGEVVWEVRDATSAVIAPDPEGFRIGLAPPATGSAVAIPRVVGSVLDAGTIAAVAPTDAATVVGEVAVTLTPGTARTVMFQWGTHTNWVHLHCSADGETHPPGMHDVVW